MELQSIALAFFLITNPIGNSPAILALIKDYSIKKQQSILIRESLLSFGLAVIFLLIGERFLSLLQVNQYAISITGGIILVLTALTMIFPRHEIDEQKTTKREPFMVPIATPILTGGGLMTTIMVYANQEANDFKIFLALIISSAATLGVLFAAPRIRQLLGDRGMTALEQLMGMVLLLLAMELNVQGASTFLRSLGN